MSNKVSGHPLCLDEAVDAGGADERSVREILDEKHPPPEPVTIVNGSPQPAHQSVFDALDASCIRHVALRTEGSAGPSGIDAVGWRRLCTSFGHASNELCDSLAATV